MITCLFYIVALIQPLGCENPINHDNDDDDEHLGPVLPLRYIICTPKLRSEGITKDSAEV